MVFMASFRSSCSFVRNSFMDFESSVAAMRFLRRDETSVAADTRKANAQKRSTDWAHSQLVLLPRLRVADDIPGSPENFECLSSSWVFILVWMDLKENHQAGCMSKGEHLHIRDNVAVHETSKSWSPTHGPGQPAVCRPSSAQLQWRAAPHPEL